MATDTMAADKPTLHHMNNSQSQRIFWLIEELEIPYNLKLHQRITTGKDKQRAPPELKETHSLGKAPQLVTVDGRVITESSAIAKYLIETYDKDRKFQGDGAKNDAIRDEELSSLAGTNINAMMLIEMIFAIIGNMSPFFVRPVIRGLHGVIHRSFTGPEMEQMFRYLDEQLADQDYFMGFQPGHADFVISWPIDFISQNKFINLADYSRLAAWHERCHARPAWKRSIEKGNGYSLAF